MFDLKNIPGSDLVLKGLQQLERKELNEEALLVLIAHQRLKALGFTFDDIPKFYRPYEHELYDMIEKKLGNGAHSEYNSLIRKIVSFSRALEKLGS